RVLAAGGKFIWTIFGQPHFRKQHLECTSWELQVEWLNDGSFNYFMYVATKKN
ncbi:hypothetical protein IWW47_006015, partial [Coemansia sp. RSA 2052]